ncbi:MAG: ATP-binding protein [Myxococcota bacterium]
MALVFPYKRDLARRFPRLIAYVYGLAIALGLAIEVLLFDPFWYSTLHRAAVSNAAIAFALLVYSQAYAFARPPTIEARQRVTVLAIGTIASMSPGIVVFVTGATTGGKAAENAVGWAGALFPLSIAYAVLRADLLQVDSILRRTVNYALVTVCVGLVYAALIGIVESAAKQHADIPRWLFILAFSCFCTFGLIPLKDKIQSSVDRTFFRSVYDFRSITEETSRTLARLIDINSIRAEIEGAVTAAFHPETVSLVILPSDAETQSEIDSADQINDQRVRDLDLGQIAVPFRSHKRVVARLILGRRLSGKFYSGEDRALLQVLANQGAVAIEKALAIEEVHELNRTLERRVQTRTAELAKTIDELRETQQQLVQAERLAAIGEIAAGVAHEVNNPLNFARNSLRALSALVDELSVYARAVGDLHFEDPNGLQAELAAFNESFKSLDATQLSHDLAQLVEILGAGLDRTARLVADLRDFASPQQSERLPFSLVEIVDRSLDLARATLNERGISVCQETLGTVPPARGDTSAIGQVILNIVKNAIDAVELRGGGTLTVTCGSDDKRGAVWARFVDNGCGIPPELVEKVFDPFFTTKEAGKGTGLGLALCRRIMHDHSGCIQIEETSGDGTSVRIELPAIPLTPNP